MAHIVLIACVGVLLISGWTAAATQPSTQPSAFADIFVSGHDSYHTFRIPSLIVTPKGTLLAFCEGRKRAQGDSGEIHTVLKRSTDGGATWGDLQVVARDGANTVGNPCPVVDRDTSTIWLPLTRNLGTDTEAAILSGAAKGTRQVLLTSSPDDGITWAEPKDITTSVKDPKWTWYATGPGVGIQLRSGRLLIPCDNSVEGTKARQSHVMYSDDHGKTWKIGGVLGPKVNECQAVELGDGSVMLNMRSYRGKGCRATAISKDGGLTFGEVENAPTLVEPVCQASLIRFAGDANTKPCLLFSNPADPKKREKLTLRISTDEGKTWPVAKVIYEGSAAYSCLAILPQEVVGCLFECDEYRRISFARIAWMQR